MQRICDLILATTCGMAALGPALASDQSDVISTIEKWVGDYNRGDMKQFVAACAPRASVIDDFPPYAWPTCADWINALEANNKASQEIGGTISLDAPSRAEVMGGRAYMVYPATFFGTEKGKSVTYKGTWTMTLLKAPNGWIFTGSAWTGH